jgi:hypothetical protein
MSEHIGERWGVTATYEKDAVTRMADPDRSGWVIHKPGPTPSYFQVCDRFGDAPPHGPFSMRDQAAAHAAALNRVDVEATWDPAFKTRRERLRALGETFWVRYGEGPWEARWPEKPGRYAVESFSERYSESFWETVESREDVEAEIVGGDVSRVVDLDTGDEIPFAVCSEVHW